jgi:hypothetical protein
VQGSQGAQGAQGAVGTSGQQLFPTAANFLSTAFPQLNLIQGTNAAIEQLQFDAAADEAAYWTFVATGYTGGDLTLKIIWYGDSATSGNVVWEAAMAAITPSVDTTNVTTAALAAATTATTAVSGSTKALVVTTITITGASLDSLAGGDYVLFRIRRLGSSGSDTMAGDADMTLAVVTWP